MVPVEMRASVGIRSEAPKAVSVSEMSNDFVASDKPSIIDRGAWWYCSYPSSVMNMVLSEMSLRVACAYINSRSVPDIYIR